MDAPARKSLDDMTTDEMLREIVAKMRTMEDALTEMSKNPMLKTFGFGKLLK